MGYVLRSAPPIGSYFVDRREGSTSRSSRVTIGRVDKAVRFGITGWLAYDAQGNKIANPITDGGRWHTRAAAAEAVWAAWTRVVVPENEQP